MVKLLNKNVKYKKLLTIKYKFIILNNNNFNNLPELAFHHKQIIEDWKKKYENRF